MEIIQSSSTSSEIINSTMDFINNLGINELKQLKIAVNQRLSCLSSNSNTHAVSEDISLYTYTKENFLKVGECNEISNELWSKLGASEKRTQRPIPRYIWYCNENIPYKFPGHPTLYPKPFSSVPELSKLLKYVNSSLGLNAHLDSCLIAFYESGEIGISPHSDDEDIIDQTSPIANISIGTSRNIKMYAKKDTKYHGTSEFTLNNGSLHIMEPGCQDRFKHEVPPQCYSNGKRICVSFRKVTKQQPNLMPINQLPSFPIPADAALGTSQPDPQFLFSPHSPDICPQNVHPPCDNNLPPPEETYTIPPAIINYTAPTPVNKTIILGTSITKPIMSLVSSPGNLINLSESGATINDLKEVITKWHYENTDVDGVIVDKVYIMCGTKDVLKSSLATSQMLKPELVDLIETVKTLLPRSDITFVSLLPIDLRFMEKNKADSVRFKVVGFNKLLKYLCRLFNMSYLNIFNRFLNPATGHIWPALYQDYVHLGPDWGVPLLARQLNMDHFDWIAHCCKPA